MTAKEKKLSGVFLGILMIGIIIRVIPFAIESYHSSIDTVEEVKQKINRLKKLQTRKKYWQTEFEKHNNKEKELLKRLFVGQSPELIAARIQGQLKILAHQSNIKVDSMSLPDLKQTETWLLISQTMSFKASSESLMALLKKIKQSKPTLIVDVIKVRLYRKELNCTIKITGFSHAIEQGSDT